MFNLFLDHGDSTTYNKLPIWFLYVLLYTIFLALLDNVIKALMEFLKGKVWVKKRAHIPLPLAQKRWVLEQNWRSKGAIELF